MSDALPVVVDDQIFTMQRFGGVSRYFVELLDHFDRDRSLGIAAKTPFRYVMNQYLRDHNPRRFAELPLPQVLRRGRIMRSANRVVRWPARTRGRLVHHTYYFPESLQMPAGARICTVYDMTPEVLPEYFPEGNPHVAKAEYVRACDAVLCISETTRRDLLAFTGGLDKPVFVTPLGVRAGFSAATPARSSPRPYALFVGSRFQYKNFDVALRAFARLRQASVDLDLLCVSAASFNSAELGRIADLGLEQVVRHRSVNDDELPSVYAGALCLLFPSRYEGFGLPTVEAFAAGCPVVLAETPCSVEVGGDAAQFFDADDDDALAGIVERLSRDEPWRRQWIDRGRRRAEGFTWRRTAQLTAQAYRQVADSAL